MQCPKCGFEQLDASAQECAKCGILFAKWRIREQARRETDEQARREADEELYLARLEASSAPAQLGVRPSQLAFEQASTSGMAPAMGSLFIRVGGLMCVLGILSFGLNMIGREFILLMPLEMFDDPTAAKFWTIGGGVALAVFGGTLGGAVGDDD